MQNIKCFITMQVTLGMAIFVSCSVVRLFWSKLKYINIHLIDGYESIWLRHTCRYLYLLNNSMSQCHCEELVNSNCCLRAASMCIVSQSCLYFQRYFHDLQNSKCFLTGKTALKSILSPSNAAEQSEGVPIVEKVCLTVSLRARFLSIQTLDTCEITTKAFRCTTHC